MSTGKIGQTPGQDAGGLFDTILMNYSAQRALRQWRLNVLVLALGAGLPGGSVRADDFNSRAAAFLNYYDTATPNLPQTGSGPHRIGRTGFWAAEGRFLNNDISNGSNFLAQALGDADSEGSDAGFSMWPAMDCYLRWSSLATVFTPAVSNLFQTQLVANGTNYGSGATSNQRMMLATAHYLAGMVWGTNAFPAGAPFSADYGTGDPSGLAYVSNTIVNIPFYGLPEHDSLIYEQFTLGPMYTLEQFAPDTVLRQQARVAFDWAVAEMAGYYFYDNWAIASDRTEPFWVPNQPTPTTMMTYLFFGGPVPGTLLEAYPSALYCLPNFPGVPPEVVMAATNRTQPYTHYSTAMRNTGGYNNAYFKTAYVTPGYAVYSQAECGVQTNGDGSYSITNYGTVSLSDPHQMQRWGVVWNAPGDQTKFWITNPYNPVYSGSAPNTYIGTTIAEQTVQLGGTVAAVYNIPTNATKPDWNHNGVAMTNYQVLEGQIPTNYSAVIDNAAAGGRVYLHYTNVLIALYVSTNFTWQADTNGTNYFLIPANVAGLAVETAAPAEYPQTTAALRLAAFRNDVLTLGGVNTNYLAGPNPAMIYTDRHGNTLQITFGQGGRTNGRSIDYQQWPAIGNPWMSQAQLGNLFIFGTNRTLIYNFNTWTEATNNQPVLLTNASVALAQNNAGTIDLAARVSDAETPAGNLLFGVSNPFNGSVALMADGHTASFTPATNYSGAAGFSFTATDEGTDPRLVLCYNFAPPGTLTSNVVADVSGNARSARLVTVGTGTAAYSPSVPAALAPFSTQSLRLTQSANGANAVALSRTITTGNLSLTNGSWTLAAWFQRATLTNDQFLFYAGSGDGFGGAGDELQLYCPANTNSVALSHWNTGNVQDLALVSAGTAGTNQWHHVALVCQHGTNGANNVSLYLDGSPAGTAGNIMWSLKQNYPLVFGGHASTASKTYRWFNGSLADLALFRGALSATEIAQLATRTVSHFGGWTITNAVTVNVSAPPVLAMISNRTVGAGVTMVITNAATVSPPQTLAFGLATAPANAVVDANTGVLMWRPAVAQAGSTNPFSVTVTGGGSPSLSATQNFTVTVAKLNPARLSGSVLANQRLSFQVSGDSGPDYTVQASTNLAAWNNLFTTNSPALPFNWTNAAVPGVSQRFYRLLLGP